MTLRLDALALPPRLAPVSLELPAGQLVGLVGPNGAGKTTLLRAIAGLEFCDGTATFDGKPLEPGPSTLAWLPATRDVAFPLTAAALVALGLGAGRHDPAAVAAALTACDALAFADRPVDRLSTGERARVLLARAIVATPRWLLLDEPVANLDPGHRLDVMALLARQAARGAGVLVALHDLDLARQHCDRLLLLDAGRVVADGPPGAVLTPDRLARVFGIRAGSAGWERAAPD